MSLARSSIAFVAPLAAFLLAGCSCDHVQGSSGDAFGSLSYSFGDVSDTVDVGTTEYSFATTDNEGNLRGVVVDDSTPTEIYIKVSVPASPVGLRTFDVTVCACMAVIVGDEAASDPHAGVQLPDCSDQQDPCEAAPATVLVSKKEIECEDGVCDGIVRATVTIMEGGLGVRGSLTLQGELTREPACYVPGLFPF
jgi:hypothetical protein